MSLIEVLLCLAVALCSTCYAINGVFVKQDRIKELNRVVSELTAKTELYQLKDNTYARCFVQSDSLRGVK